MEFLLKVCDFYRGLTWTLLFQEVEPRVGEELCRMFPEDETIDLRSIALKAKRSIKRYIERERLGRPREPAAPHATATSRLGTSAFELNGG